ncbi:efflux transporter outer membrane subunit [Pseudomonas rhizoryzae]|uniref:efflux transporter outer membrane subunit n=1 Tax=Pseudomonas rhizoryzae TaxID=2571129 RepID=UPI00073602C6|nr:efflux transporter outer membrane subunit [Pseudomonas rhizoryzae]KTT30662.1 RND transporter [Pseudomonas psychrotolerans]KTT76976.1 RND transporter [Pseudomonas psychrotolerans]
MPALRDLPPLLLLALLAGCTVGPDYQRPSAPLSTQFKEAAGWKAASPRDDQAKGAWWQAYEDPQLAALLGQVAVSNQNVAQYQALYRQARALVRESRAETLPSATLDAKATRSENASSASGSSSTTAGGATVRNAESLSLGLSWDLDLWGKLRRTLEEDRASAQASAAELANATLSAQAELAQDYFQLRILDRRLALYDQTLADYRRYLAVIQNRYDEQLASRADLAQARTQLDSAEADRLALTAQRAQLEHAIALLLGKPPADFSLAVDPHWQARLPDIPAGLPTALLERRPDIAQAERQVAAANAAIGVATAAYYPDLTLSASGGYQSSLLGELFKTPSRFWSLGPTLSGTLFDFGATRAGVDQARAAYDAKVASYRQTVLTALGEVEDYLVALHTLDPEIAAQRRAVAAARDSASVTRDQYEAGMIDYLDVATTQATQLSQEQSLLQLESSQLVTSVQLQMALGGDWQATRLADEP